MTDSVEPSKGQRDTLESRIKLEKTSKNYRMGQIQIEALREITLEVMAGEFIVFLGPSGSGKTTLLNLIGGLDSPSSGRIVVNGIDITQLTANQLTKFRRTQIGFIFQFFNLIPTLTARENVEFAAELVAHPRSSEEILREVGLEERMNHFPSELSGGENQRVAIARALATDPSVILCDEPTGSLDFETGKRIFKLLRVLNETKLKTVVVVTHNSAIGDIAHRIVRLRDGKVAEVIQNTHPLDPDELKW
ncbi:MAG TPA: ABC transporter ATP-binding protein [Dehalococcoidia bacterium]|nr:ABC transporter ATP-binding protein [Dehalococcoidia bacterium]